MAGKKKQISPSAKVLKSRLGKLGKLTFKDLSDLGQVLMDYKGDLPSGYARRRKGGQFCVMKKP